MKNLNQSFRRFFFSSKCSICRQEHYEKHSYICYNCYERIKKKIALNKIENIYYTCYYDRDIKKLIASLKLNGRRYLSKEVAKLITPLIEEVIEKEEIDLVIAVPISKKRLRDRGFNQVEEILKESNIDYSSLKRIRDTQPMHGILNKKQREINVKDSFSSSLKVEDRNILIVDDIVTTGSTIRELIKTLDGQPKNITVFTFSIAKTAMANSIAF